MKICWLIAKEISNKVEDFEQRKIGDWKNSEERPTIPENLSETLTQRVSIREF